MNLIDLFSGIGGFSLSAHWLGWQTIAFVEKDEFCQKVLAKNFKDVPIYGDIKEFDGKRFADATDIVCGGFPCQPFSIAGERKGTNDDRYLWDETLRIVSEAKPAWFVGENVAGIASMVFDVSESTMESLVVSRHSETDYFNKILSRQEVMQLETCCENLESEGYEVQPFIIPACSVNAPHRRDRVWIIAHADRFGRDNEQKENGQIIQDKVRQLSASQQSGSVKQCGTGEYDSAFTDADNQRQLQPQRSERAFGGRAGNCDKPATSDSFERLFGKIAQQTERQLRQENQGDASDSDGKRLQRRRNDVRSERTQSDDKQFVGRDRNWSESWIQVAAEFCRVDARVSNRVDRLKSLGNAIVPQIAFEIFKAIEFAESQT